MKRQAVLTTGFAAMVGGLGIVAAAASSAVSAADDLKSAQGRLVSVRQSGAPTGQVLAALRQADEDVDDAARSLDGWSVDVLAAVPLVGRSWDAERAVVRTAQEVISGALVVAQRLPSVAASAGAVDLSALAEVHGEVSKTAERSRVAFEDLQEVPTGFTPSPVSRGVAQARAALGPAVETLHVAERGLDVVPRLLGGDRPRSLLVMLQNNAELRGAGGYAASFATGRTEAGRLTLGPLQDVVDVADPPGRARRVPAPDEYLEDYGPLSGDTTIWRSWNMSPHVPDSALVGARVAGRLLPQQPDLVLLLDVPALGALAALGGTGVSLPDGSSVSPDELTDALLVDAYAAAGEGPAAQDRRRSDLQAAATSAVSGLLAEGVPASAMVRTLASLAAGRHLSVWSAVPEEQAVLEELDLAGAVDAPAGADLFHVSVNNVGGNKLDYYVRRELEVDVALGGTRAAVTQRVRFTNEAPPDLVPYVAGLERPGVLVSRVELSLPPQAYEIAGRVDEKPWQGALHTGGGRQRLSTYVETPRGASSVFEVRYALPVNDGRYALRLIPQPLIEDAALRLTVRATPGERLRDGAGSELRDGRVHEVGRLSTVRDVSAELVRATPSRWQRVKEWWNAPVELGLARH